MGAVFPFRHTACLHWIAELGQKRVLFVFSRLALQLQKYDCKNPSAIHSPVTTDSVFMEKHTFRYGDTMLYLFTLIIFNLLKEVNTITYQLLKVAC